VNGAGPCPNGNIQNCFQDSVNNAGPLVTNGISHVGRAATSPIDQHEGGLECYACHATWTLSCFGCHLTLADFNGQILRDFSRATGELTYGVVAQADFSYIATLDMQYGINSEGKIAQMIPETKQAFRHIDYQGNDYFGTRVLVNNNANLVYNVYRHRSGYGLRQYATEVVGLPLNADGNDYDPQDARMDQNAGEGFNQFMPHTIQRSHPMMDCENCHLNANDANANAVTARYGVNPNGFANVSAYLIALNGLQIVRNNTNQVINVDQNAGFRFDANIDPDAFVVNRQTDYVVFNDGFPLSFNSHPLMLGRPNNPPFDPFYQRTYPRIAQVAGPINVQLIQKLTAGQVRVANEGVQYRSIR
jgi:hypothetical protein